MTGRYVWCLSCERRACGACEWGYFAESVVGCPCCGSVDGEYAARRGRMTLRKWFDEFAKATGETPMEVVFGGPPLWYGERWSDLPSEGEVVLFSSVPDTVLDRDFRGGYAAVETPGLCAWSESWVIFSDRYDGGAELLWIPSVPISHIPIRPGGG